MSDKFNTETLTEKLYHSNIMSDGMMLSVNPIDEVSMRLSHMRYATEPPIDLNDSEDDLPSI